MGTLTITTTAPQDARIVTAFGHRLGTVDGEGVPRAATAGEVRTEIISLLKTIVLQYEKRVASDSAQAAVVEIDVT